MESDQKSSVGFAYKLWQVDFLHVRWKIIAVFDWFNFMCFGIIKSFVGKLINRFWLIWSFLISLVISGIVEWLGVVELWLPLNWKESSQPLFNTQFDKIKWNSQHVSPAKHQFQLARYQFKSFQHFRNFNYVGVNFHNFFFTRIFSINYFPLDQLVGGWLQIGSRGPEKKPKKWLTLKSQ